jgi:hypothetical protein
MLNFACKHYWLLSGFRRKPDEKCALLGYYAASSANFLPNFRENLLENVIDKLRQNVGRNYRYSLRNNPEERIFLQLLFRKV